MMAFRALLVVALFSMIGLIGIAKTNGYSQPQAAADMQSLLKLAVDVAQDNRGATVTFTPGANNTTVVALWAGRPNWDTMETEPRKFFTTDSTIAVAGIAASASPSPALVISTGGFVNVTQWSPTFGTATGPSTLTLSPCNSPVQITLTKDSVSQTYSVPCAAASQMQ
jgi:hypothetical protein